MRPLRCLLGLVLLFAPNGFAAPDAPPPLAAYLGSQGCARCHADKHDGWKRTFHSTVVQDAKARPEAILGDFSAPGVGARREDVLFTIGGHWTQRYMVRIGEEYYALPKAWSVASQKWETTDAWSWKKKPYRQYCVGCHSTRFDPKTGSYAEHTVGCESCHGPGRSHADAGGKAAIVNPQRLGQEATDLLCASCHVRGADPTGTYQFAAGFVPGRDLTEYYVPFQAAEGEPRKEAFLRLFGEWRDRVKRGPAGCEVCGLYGEKGAKEAQEVKTITDYCLGCHKFGDAYATHTRHSASVQIGCLDCHRKVELAASAEEDVHSVGYFLVHTETCYDKDFTKACGTCHSDFTAARIASLVLTWKGARPVIHD